jgi:hypothetical protein
MQQNTGMKPTKSPIVSLTVPYVLSSSGDLQLMRKTQWDKEGIEDLARSSGWQDHPFRPDKGRAVSGERV